MLALALLSAPWVNVPADNADGAGMQAHLHAIFEAGDLLYDDEYAALRMSALFAFVTEQGVVSNHWPAGASFVQAPGWLLGRLAGVSMLGDGVSPRAATWTLPLLGLRCWALLVWVWLGVRVHRWLSTRIERSASLVASAALLLGTPALAYAAEYPIRPHLWGTVAVAIATMRWFDALEFAEDDPQRAARRWSTPLELAVWVGLATAIRPQLAPLALLVAHERFVALREHSLGERAKLIALHGLGAAAVFSVWPALVVRMQVWMYGGVGDYGGEVSHHLKAFMLSTHHGALLWCPVLVIALLGVAIGVAERQRGALLVLGLIALQIWLDAGTREIEPYRVLGTRTWTGGTSFGPRKLLDAMPLMLPGAIWISRWIAGQEPLEAAKWRRRLGAATGLAILPTLLLLAGAFVDHRVCSTVLDPERFAIASTLGFDPDNWAMAWAERGLPAKVALRVGAVVGIPLASLVVITLAAQRGSTGRGAGAEAYAPRRPWAALLLVVYGLGAHLWLARLETQSEALLAADPQRMTRAAEQLNPWHEALVSEIPRHSEVLRERLGPSAVP